MRSRSLFSSARAGGTRTSRPRIQAAAFTAVPSIEREAGQGVALEPGIRDVLEAVVAEAGDGGQRGIHRVDDDRLGGADAAEPLRETPVIENLQHAAAVRIELRLDRVEAAL